MSINTNPNASDPITKKQLITKPEVLIKENTNKENKTEEIQNEDTIVNEQEQNQVVNSQEQEAYIGGNDINEIQDKSISHENNLKNNLTLNTKNPGKDDDDDDTDDDDDDEDNEPEREIEIGDDPEETKKKIPVM